MDLHDVDLDQPVVIVRDTAQDRDGIVWQAAKIGYDRLVGGLAGGPPSWTAAGLPTARTSLLGVDELGGRDSLDGRQRVEYDAGHVPGARSVELGRLAGGHDAAVRDGAAVMCGYGERAMTAVSLLERTGVRDLAVVVGGPEDWAAHNVQPLQGGG